MRSNAGYVGVHVGFGFCSRNSDGLKVIEFVAGLDCAICSTYFKGGFEVVDLCFGFRAQLRALVVCRGNCYVCR